MQRVSVLDRIVSNVEQVILDKRTQIELALVTLLCRGHLLIEDVPGVGKTSLASALAKSLSCTFTRIQFTPDVMPTDITGFSAYNPKTGDFDYKPGAIFSQFVLADEINRTAPKTQSSLLEAMEEKQVTVDGVTRRLLEPFMVLATQNPLDYLGTYPLPEAQMDRFFMRISLGYPSVTEEKKLITRLHMPPPLETLQPVASGNDVQMIQRLVDQIHVDERISEYIVSLVRRTRDNEYVALGASPRATINLCRAAQAWALYCGRNYVIPDDVIYMARHVMAHRIILRQEGKLKELTQEDIVDMAVKSVRVPTV